MLLCRETDEALTVGDLLMSPGCSCSTFSTSVKEVHSIKYNVIVNVNLVASVAHGMLSKLPVGYEHILQTAYDIVLLVLYM